MEGNNTTPPEFDIPDTAPRTQRTMEFDSIDDLTKKLPEELDPGAEVNCFFVATENARMKTGKGPLTIEELIKIVTNYQKSTGSRVNDVTFDIDV
jgi:hypothetical protein